MSKQILTQARLKELLHYNPDTGVFTWRVNISNVKVGSVAGCNDNGYVAFRIDGKKYRAHRMAWLYMEGRIPKEVDHDNRDKSNNRWDNLNAADSLANSRNMSVRKDNKSGRTGVYQRGDRWIAEIRVDRKQIYLGIFSNKDAAICRRKEAEIQYGFHDNHGT